MLYVSVAVDKQHTVDKQGNVCKIVLKALVIAVCKQPQAQCYVTKGTISFYSWLDGINV